MSYAQEELRTIRNLAPATHTQTILTMYELAGRLNKVPDYMAIAKMLEALIQYCELHDRIDLVDCLKRYNDARR